MQNRTLSTSLIISAALALPSLAMAVTPDATDLPPISDASVDTETSTETNTGPANTANDTSPNQNKTLDTEPPESQPNTDKSIDTKTATEVAAETQAMFKQYNDPNYQPPKADVDSSMPEADNSTLNNSDEQDSKQPL